jgi:hypothetical protein
MFVQPFDVRYPSNVLLAASSSGGSRLGLRGNSKQSMANAIYDVSTVLEFSFCFFRCRYSVVHSANGLFRSEVIYIAPVNCLSLRI